MSNDSKLIVSLLGVIASLAVLIVSTVGFLGLKGDVIYWGRSTVCFTGDSVPYIPVKEPHYEGRITFFGKEIYSYDDVHQNWFGQALPFFCGVAALTSFIGLAMLSRLYQHYYHMQFIVIEPFDAKNDNSSQVR